MTAEPAAGPRELIARGIAAGVISAEQADRLLALDGDASGPPGVDDPPRDDERLRFVTGFADIFVTLGLLLFLGAARSLGQRALGSAGGEALTAGLSWLLAEFFTRRRRMALPSIVLLAAFAYASFAAVSTALRPAGASLFALVFAPGRAAGDMPYLGAAPEPGVDPLALAAAAAATLGLVVLHYRRFQVPVTVAAGAAALTATVIALALAAWPEAGRAARSALFVLAGCASFTLAMRFDLSDPGRLTRRSDIAFWLHLLAAPLIVHPVLSALIAGDAAVSPGKAVAVLAGVLLLSLIALVTDRRAILVSGLVYAGVAVGRLLREVGASVSLPLTLLALGAFVLLLSAGWHPLRGAVLRLLPARIGRRLPHPVGV